MFCSVYELQGKDTQQKNLSIKFEGQLCWKASSPVLIFRELLDTRLSIFLHLL